MASGRFSDRFEDFIEQGKVRRSSADRNLARSIVKNSELDLKFLEKLEVNIYSARKIMCNYYDVLRSILEAVSILDRYKIYSHEAFRSFLKIKNENLAAVKFDRFRKIRNKINYYGASIRPEETEENIKEITKLIEYLKKKYLFRTQEGP